PEAIPVLRAALTNQSQAVRVWALRSLCVTPEGARAAVPAMLAWRQLPETSLGEAALETTTKLPEEEMLHVLTEYARDPRWRGSLEILVALRRYPTNVVVAA